MRIHDGEFDAGLVARAARTCTVDRLSGAGDPRHGLALHVAADLVAIGGYGVAAGSHLMDAWIAARAEIDEGARAVIATDVNDTCHWNCLRAIERDGSLRHVSGYALSADGLWHEHSWLREAGGALIETTGTERLAYVGADVDRAPAGIASFLDGAEWIDEAASDEIDAAVEHETRGLAIRSAETSIAALRAAASRRLDARAMAA